IADQEALSYPKNTTMLLDLGYVGYSAENLTVILPHKKPYRDELTLEQKQQNTKHSQNRVCNEHTMKGIKRMRIVKDLLILNVFNYADSLFINACALHNFRVKSPMRAYSRANSHVSKIIFN
ncbi:transposase family protein, partial [Arcicella aquatica]